VSGLGGEGAPVGGDGADGHAVARLEEAHQVADLLDDADGFVSEGEVGPLTDRAVGRVHVGGTDECLGGSDECLEWAGFGDGLVHEPHLTNLAHDECTH
jgi:hypothetical protein